MISKLIENFTAMDTPFEGEPSEEQLEQVIEAGAAEFAELIDAGKKVPDPHLIAIMAHGGVHVYENCTEEDGNSFDDLKRIAESVIAVVSEYIAEYEGEDALAAWLARLTCDNL